MFSYRSQYGIYVLILLFSGCVDDHQFNITKLYCLSIACAFFLCYMCVFLDLPYSVCVDDHEFKMASTGKCKQTKNIK